MSQEQGQQVDELETAFTPPPEPPREQIQPAPEAPAPSDETPDISDALATLNDRLGGIESRLERKPEPVDPYRALTDEPEYEPDPNDNGQPEGQVSEADALVSEFNALVDERVEQILAPRFEAQAEEKRAEGIRALAKEFPDFATPEVLDPIATEMEQLAREYGNPALRTDPRLARRLYQAHKAEAVAAAETPAEAVSPGATLETGAGPGNGNQEPSPEQRYVDTLMSAVGGGKDAFT